MISLLLAISAPALQIAYVLKGDIWTCDQEGKNQKRVVKQGEHPCWSPNHDKLCFVRLNTLMVIDLSSRRETVIWKSPKGSTIDPPSWGRRWGTARWDDRDPSFKRGNGDSILFTSSNNPSSFNQITSDGRKLERRGFLRLPQTDSIDCPTWSADGKHLALSLNGDVWVGTIDIGRPGQGDSGWMSYRLVASAEYDYATNRADMYMLWTKKIAWSPRNDTLAYIRMAQGTAELWIARLGSKDGYLSVTMNRAIPAFVLSCAFSKDGDTLYCET